MRNAAPVLFIDSKSGIHMQTQILSRFYLDVVDPLTEAVTEAVTGSAVENAQSNPISEFFANFAHRFYLNFIKEDRWHYLTDGLATTFIITICAVLIGVVIGMLVAIVRSSYDKNGSFPVLNWICKLYLTVIRGTPVVVQLMIIYFVIFGSVKIDKTIVAVIAFGINSGAYVAEICRAGIMSIDNGQFEAGRSLGFNYGKTMWYIIIPQAFKNVLPALGNELIVLLKETSVCGYIALQDLTKGGDIIRSRTYDAFMPLLMVALIYLVIVMGLEKLVSLLERRLRSDEAR